MAATIGLDPAGMHRLARDLAAAEQELRRLHHAVAHACRVAGVADPTGGRILAAAVRCEHARADVRRRTAIVEWRLDAWSRSGLDLVLRLGAPGLGLLGVDRLGLGALPPWWRHGRRLTRGYHVAAAVEDVGTEVGRLRVLARTGDAAAAHRAADGWSVLVGGLATAADAAARGPVAVRELAVPLHATARAGRAVAGALPVVDALVDARILVDPPHDGTYGMVDRVVAGTSLVATGVSMGAAAGVLTLTPVGATVVSAVLVGGAVYTLGTMAWDAWGDDVGRAARAVADRVGGAVRTGWQRAEAGGRVALDRAVDAGATVVDAGRRLRDGLATGIDLGVAWSDERLDELADVADGVLDAVTFWD